MTNEERGAAVLDEKFPGWEDKIDTDTLDMSSIHKCILGQLYGDYFVGRDHIFPFYGLEDPVDSSKEHGFDSSVSNDRWIDLVKKRRNDMSISLQLTQEEAKTLLIITNKIAGDPHQSRRAHVDSVRNKILQNGVDDVVERFDGAIGYIRFIDDTIKYSEVKPGEQFNYNGCNYIVMAEKDRQSHTCMNLDRSCKITSFSPNIIVTRVSH